MEVYLLDIATIVHGGAPSSSAFGSDEMEALLKANIESAVRCLDDETPFCLVCYFTDTPTRSAANITLSRLGFDICVSLPGHHNFSDIVIYEGRIPPPFARL